MKFLETITALAYPVLVPVDRIKFINQSIDEDGLLIRITSDDGNWGERFGSDTAACNARFNEIKKLLEEPK